MYLPSSRRVNFLLASLSIIALLVILHQTYQRRLSLFPLSSSASTSSSTHQVEYDDYAVQSRVERLRAICGEEDPFEREYGRANLRMSRAYEGLVHDLKSWHELNCAYSGSHHRLRQLLQKSIRGESLTVAAIGGSSTSRMYGDRR